MRVLAAVLAVLGSCSSGAMAAVPLAAHHAVYGLTYDSDQPAATGDSAIVGAHGTMTYDIDDACTGWATDQRLQITLNNREGQAIQMVSDYATFEAKDGLRMEFHMKQTTDGAVTQKLDGSATLQSAGGGKVSYVMPAARTMTLPSGTLFPMAHTAAILAAAEQGKKFLSLPLFDGTGADGAQDTFVTVLDWGSKIDVAWPGLAALPSGRMHISFFDREKAGGGQTPDYQIGMRYFENGVADALHMNFGEFVMTGALKTFQLASPPRC